MKLFIGVILCSVAGLAAADDGILYTFGTPKLMRGESNISMVQEFVRAKVYHDHATVYCRFVFRNDGPAVLAKIGFPDGNGHDFEEGSDPAVPELHSFRSEVDGKPVSVGLQHGKEGRDEVSFFHVKSVRFGRHQTRVIEDWYRAPLSGGGTSSFHKGREESEGNLYMSQFTYAMFSGASWHGPIGKATLVAEFMEPKFRHLKALTNDEVGGAYDSQWYGKIKNDRVVWSGFARPSVHDNVLVFRRRNFKPMGNDNIALTFNWALRKNTIWSRFDH